MLSPQLRSNFFHEVNLVVQYCLQNRPTSSCDQWKYFSYPYTVKGPFCIRMCHLQISQLWTCNFVSPLVQGVCSKIRLLGFPIRSSIFCSIMETLQFMMDDKWQVQTNLLCRVLISRRNLVIMLRVKLHFKTYQILMNAVGALLFHCHNTVSVARRSMEKPTHLL